MGVSSMELRPEASAYNYGPATSAAPTGGMQPAYQTAPNAPKVVASYASVTGAPAASPGLTRSLVVPARIQEPAHAAGGIKVGVGAPYYVGGKWYTPRHDHNYSKVGLASWYSPEFHGKPTSSGEAYNKHALTAAHQTLPLSCYVRVTNLKNGHNVLVRINDRGPFKPGRIIDLSGRAAQELGFQTSGVAPVRVEYVGMTPTPEVAQAKPQKGNKS